MFVQSLRGHPTCDGVTGVIVNYTDSSRGFEMVVLDAELAHETTDGDTGGELDVDEMLARSSEIQPPTQGPAAPSPEWTLTGWKLLADAQRDATEAHELSAFGSAALGATSLPLPSALGGAVKVREALGPSGTDIVLLLPALSLGGSTMRAAAHQSHPFSSSASPQGNHAESWRF